jgi:SSS family solute:Na+ symporter
MFWKRMTPAAGLWGLVAGTAAAAITFVLYKTKVIHFGSDLAESMIGASLAFVVDAIVTVLVTVRTRPKPVSELQGLVYGMANTDGAAMSRVPLIMGLSVLAGALVLTIIFW